MKVIHRICISPKRDAKVRKKFLKLGIKMREIMGKKKALSNYFDISEDNLLWPEVEKVLSSAGILTLAHTEFTKKEIMSAEWVRINPVYFEDDGFPEPNLEHISWKKASFDYKDECPDCGIGLRQNAPIRLKGEPNLKDNDFISIFWVYSIFARNEIFDILSQKGVTGFEAYPVIHHKKNVPLTTVKQLKITVELEAGIIDDNLRRSDVERITVDNIITHKDFPCGHVKYLGLGRGMYKFSRNTFGDKPDLVKSHEWFGGGYEATQLILASAKFVQVYMENNWRGLSLAPIELL